MERRRENIDTILFNYQTTHRTTFRERDVAPTDITVHKEKPHLVIKKEERTSVIKKPDVKYVYTMSSWKCDPVPFDIMMQRKQIIRTNPHETIPSVYEHLGDLELDEVRRTRPRLVMTPAVSMDDVDDTKREVLLNDIYTTHNMREYGDRGNLPSVKSPLRGKYAPPLPTMLQKYWPHYVSPEWRTQSAPWDRRQYRGYCDSTKAFWLNRS